MTTTGTQAVDRAAQLVSLVVRAEHGVSFTDLAAETGLARSTTSRLLSALDRSGLITRDSAGAFRPGPLFAQYAARRGDHDDLARTCLPVMEALGGLTGETINLGAVRGGEVVHLAQVNSTYILASRDWVGVQVPSHLSALGKVFFAHRVLPLPTEPLERATDRSVTSPAELRRHLADVLAAGYAVTVDELEVGLTGIAAPIIVGGECIAALGLSGATARLAERIPTLGPSVARHARALAQQISRHRKDGAA